VSAAGCCLQVFAREPVAGRVKTRLVPALGADGAVAVYRVLLQRTLNAACAAAVDRGELWLDRPAADPRALARLAGCELAARVQPDGDLGARMLAAIAGGLRLSARVVLIGSDCPELTAGYIERAFAALDRHDVVLGPTHDGGYILVGMKRPHPVLFTDMAWSTPDVLATTRERLRGADLSWHELPARADIDLPQDLDRFPDILDAAGLAPARPSNPLESHR
jgi:rSAM/selenodomain-associated transferase 1